MGCFHFHGINCPCGFERGSEVDFADPNNPSLNEFYDQIAWFTTKSGEIALSMEYADGMSFPSTLRARMHKLGILRP